VRSLSVREAVEGYPYTEFVGKYPLHLGVRYASFGTNEFGPQPGWGADLSLYYFSMSLEELGLKYGEARLSWLVLMPGIQLLAPEYPANRFSLFLGGLGVGIGYNGFTAQASTDQGDPSTWDIQIDNSIVFSAFPVKLAYLLSRRSALGLSFSGIMGSKAGTEWRLDGQLVPDIKHLGLENFQILATYDLLYF
jgi:hypothetical protein